MKQDDFAKFTELVKQREQLDAELKKFQHKLTVCFVDIVGSTSYFEQHGDDKGVVWVHECIDILSRIAVEHGGTICKTIGDAVMTSYDDPVKGVQAAMQMQQAIEAHNETCAADMKMKVRIGLNYGDGLVKEKDVFGDVVNVAARIESAAKADQIYISEALQQEIKAANIPVQKLPDLAAKGKAERVSIYEVLWMRDKTGKPMSAARMPSPTMAGRTPLTEASKPPSGTVVLSAHAIADLLAKPQLQYSLVIVRPDGTHGQSHKIEKPVATLGRVEGDILFPDDNLVSRRHARLTVSAEGLMVEDLNSANGVYWRLRKPYPLQHSDVVLMGRQMFRFHDPANASTSSKDAKGGPPAGPELVRLLPGGVEENRYPLPPGESVVGRTRGTINFPDDAYLSGQHARVRNSDGKCTLEDLQAVNGTFIAVRKGVTLTDGDILLVGHQLLRITSTAS
jgi:class 3 adenylate cyclase/pSer/pThr/pTyr-binding forkhead associated (FHA) protein